MTPDNETMDRRWREFVDHYSKSDAEPDRSIVLWQAARYNALVRYLQCVKDEIERKML